MKPNNAKKIEALLKKKRAVVAKITAHNDVLGAKRTRLTDKYEADLNKLLSAHNTAIKPLKEKEIKFNVELIKLGYNPLAHHVHQD